MSIRTFLSLFIFSLPVLYSQETQKYWIFLTDKPESSTRLVLDERRLEKRFRNSKNITDDKDYPVSPTYIKKLEAEKLSILTSSRWLNAVSAELTAEQKSKIEKLSFVKFIQPVKIGKADILTHSPAEQAIDLGYGSSRKQNAMINAIAAHQAGFTGKGVRIGMIDTGFNLDHKAFTNIHVVGDSDFVQLDGDVSERSQNPKNQYSHGTIVLSCIAAKDDGSMIGTAYGADYLLARVWKDDGLALGSEDNYVAALEWFEEQSVDIVSSSVSFGEDFDYVYRELDGKTAITTLATNIAFDKGMLVFNSAGNDGPDGHIGTPSDGKKMIAVGYTNSDSGVANSSSRGPTYDGRKKPDLAALGHNIFTVNSNDTSGNGYQFNSGTSVSTPLVAGIAALALEAHPTWSAQKLYSTILKTSSRANNPDNKIGYGIPDALKLVYYVNQKSIELPFRDIKNFPNPANPSASIQFKAIENGSFSIHIYNSIGQLVRTLTENESAVTNQIITKLWGGDNDQGSRVSSGTYFYRISMSGEHITRRLLLVK